MTARRILSLFIVTVILLCTFSVYAENTSGENVPGNIVTESTAKEGITDTEDSAANEDVNLNPESTLKEDMAFLDGIFVDILGCSPIVPYGESLSVTIQLKNVPETRFGTAQWYIDGVPLTPYYYSNFEFSEGKVYKLLYPIEFTRDSGNEITVWFDMVVGDYLRRIGFFVPLEVYSDEFYDEQDALLASVKPVDIEATVKYDTYTYSDKNLKNQKSLIKKGTRVHYKDSFEFEKLNLISAYIRTADGQYSYINLNDISVSRKNYTVSEDHLITIKEKFVNAKKYKSKTNYLVWINLERQKVNVFLGSGNGGDWRLLREFPCATGTNATPTPEGEFEYITWNYRWTFPTYYVEPVLYFDMYRGLAFHSRPYNHNGVIIEKAIGTPASHGCIRMYDEDVLWLRDYLPFSTAVYVY